VLPVYLLDDEAPGRWRMGAASRWWLAGSLEILGARLAALGAPLLLRRGPAERLLPRLAAEVGAAAVHWNRCYEPWSVRRDSRLKAALRQGGIAVESHGAALLFEPWTLLTRQDEPYRVFTPFWKACLAQPAPPQPLAAPAQIPGAAGPPGERLEDWALRPGKPDWAGGLRAAWQPGEPGAQGRLVRFLDGAMAGYPERRDLPGEAGTSALSPHLHFGEISPRTLWHAVRAAEAAGGAALARGAQSFLRELGWREFSHHLLYHFPTLPEANWRPEFDALPWRNDSAALSAWQRGRTGYPIVDAGMRELWATGWMHNRVRMLAASFLAKHLLLDWRLGEAWFWDTLVDADLANNAASWQWVAGTGADAAPYFRIFNPTLQGRRFDPDGRYVRRWVPELARLPDEALHEPWQASDETLLRAGVALGKTYPERLVPHEAARRRALAAYDAVKRGAA